MKSRLKRAASQILARGKTVKKRSRCRISGAGPNKKEWHLNGAFFMAKLWHKSSWELNQFVEYFETRDDLELDQALLFYDLLGSLAHAKQLFKMKILTKDEFLQIKKGLSEILDLSNKDKFNLEFGDEDIHSKIENYLTEKYGEVGRKIHTGRSRNDQVLTALRLYTKHKLLDIWQETVILSDDLYRFSKKYERVLMPGYTHMQKAMPQTVGMWAGSFFASLIDDLDILRSSFEINNQSPLGSGAGFGMPLKLDRKLTADLLGFERTQIPAVYAQNARGKIEATVLASLVSILQTLNKLSSDILLFTTSEFDFFEVDPSICSGSSAMPQKKNVDLAELIRSKLHIVLGNYTQVVSLSSNLISGYNRDFQDTKKALFESLETTLLTLKASRVLIANINPKKEVLKSSLTSELFATHEAYKRVAEGVSFRNAYQQVGQNLDKVKPDVEDLFKLSTHDGSIGDLGLDQLQRYRQKNLSDLKINAVRFKKVIRLLGLFNKNPNEIMRVANLKLLRKYDLPMIR